MTNSKQKHSMQPRPNHDESVRQDFVTDLRAFLTDEIYPKITPYYEKNAEQKFIQEKNRKPEDKNEVRDLMLKDNAYQSLIGIIFQHKICLLYTSPSPRDRG